MILDLDYLKKVHERDMDFGRWLLAMTDNMPTDWNLVDEELAYAVHCWSIGEDAWETGAQIAEERWRNKCLA